ncbi:MAG: phosphoglucosamine mutase [Spirochaetes bacterium]|nr:phosphoglucosamine mutase [Spirochaetota bacterium]
MSTKKTAAKTLKASISGIRGIIGAGLDVETIVRYVNAYASLFPRKSAFAVGRDTRITGDAITKVVCGALAANGMDVHDCGIAPTPTVLYTVKNRKLAGGIIVTASHNPIEWNALKFAGAGGVFLGQKQVDRLLAASAVNEPVTTGAREYGSIGVYPCAVSDHVDAVVRYVNAKKIRAAKLTVACDFANGTGLVSTPVLLERLGVKLVAVNDELTGTFAHSPEPTVETMAELSQFIKRKKADIGFMQDPDADRLAFVDEKGRIVGEEYTLAVAAQHIFSKHTTDAAVNLSTSRMIDDVAKEYGRKVLRTKIGEINVTETILAKKLYFGGEGNGGVIVPSVTAGRDSLLAMAIILERMAETGSRISEIVDAIPSYSIIKDKVNARNADVKKIYAAMRKVFAGAVINDIDGIRADVADGWVHVRTSNTEPVIRIIAEARDIDTARQLIEKAKATI